ncbi:MAG: tryptophan 2,3-dioxygenase [Burkholderiales bacterium]|nr:tryptophan 2,3-dioxygenase [Burkholderiales bacterium]
MPSYKPQIPKIVDPSGVSPGLQARPMPVTSDQSRAYTAQTTGGKPMVDFEGTSNPYVDYQSIDLLLSLQHPRSEGYDEMCFFVMGQVKELLFKALHFELYNAQQQIRADAVDNALEILVRAKALVQYIGDSWNVLSTISPAGFNQFRDTLGTASGQLSFMYRHVEFILGNKNARLASAFRNMPHVWPALQSALTSPSLYDDVIAFLGRKGLAIDTGALQRDWSQAYVPNPSVEQAWMQVYANPVPGNALYRLGESLIALADQLSQYRWRHFVSVQRIIGMKPGTGGSAGVGWLQHVTEHRFFPELWAIRTSF